MKGNYTVIDTETTGLSPTSNSGGQYGYLIELGAVKIENGILTDRYHTFIQPPNRIPNNITELTGISNEMVKGAPTYQAALKEMYQWMNKDSTLIFHNAPFDLKFLNYYGKEIGINFENYKIIDTVDLAKKVLAKDVLKKEEEKHNCLTKTGKVSYRLESLAKVLYIPDPEHHRADNDAEVTWKLFKILSKHIKEENMTSDKKEDNSADWLKNFRIISANLWPKDKPWRIYLRISGNDRQYGDIFYDFKNETWGTKQAPYVIKSYKEIEKELLKKYNCSDMDISNFRYERRL